MIKAPVIASVQHENKSFLLFFNLYSTVFIPQISVHLFFSFISSLTHAQLVRVILCEMDWKFTNPLETAGNQRPADHTTVHICIQLQHAFACRL